MKKLTFRNVVKSEKFGLWLFVAIFAVAGVATLFRVLAAPPIKSSAISLSVAPASQKVKNGATLELAVWEDSKSTAVNAVQADLTYPADKFDFVSIDAANSAFAVEASSTGGDGKISIARGTTTEVSGRQLVATVQLRARVASGKATVSFASTSSLLSSQDNANILQQTTGGTYSFSR